MAAEVAGGHGDGLGRGDLSEPLSAVRAAPLRAATPSAPAPAAEFRGGVGDPGDPESPTPPHLLSREEGLPPPSRAASGPSQPRSSASASAGPRPGKGESGRWPGHARILGSPPSPGVPKGPFHQKFLPEVPLGPISYHLPGSPLLILEKMREEVGPVPRGHLQWLEESVLCFRLQAWEPTLLLLGGAGRAARGGGPPSSESCRNPGQEEGEGLGCPRGQPVSGQCSHLTPGSCRKQVTEGLEARAPAGRPHREELGPSTVRGCRKGSRAPRNRPRHSGQNCARGSSGPRLVGHKELEA